MNQQRRMEYQLQNHFFTFTEAIMRVWRNRQTRGSQKPVPQRSIGSTPITRTSA